MSDTPQYILDFIKALCPDAPALYMSSFNAEHALIDATALINNLTSELAAARQSAEPFLMARIEKAEKDAAYYKWRLTEIVPLFESARDALPCISMASAKLHNIDLSLGDRMDAAGTRTRADFDAEITTEKK